jgi:group I intron endonuclease
MVGIYKITNPRGQAYIGLSKNIEKRFQSHKNLQFKGNIKLRESLIQYGGGSHLFEVIEEVNISTLGRSQANNLLQIRERYWINHFKTFDDGLNANRGGSGCGSHTAESKRLIGKANSKPKPKDFGVNRKKWQHTEEYKAKMRNAARKPIIVLSIDGKITKEFNTQIQAAKWINTSPQILQLILRKKPQSNGKIPTSTKGFKISYK